MNYLLILLAVSMAVSGLGWIYFIYFFQFMKVFSNVHMSCLCSSHKPQCGDADADGGWEDSPQGREAGEKCAAGSEYMT